MKPLGSTEPGAMVIEVTRGVLRALHGGEVREWNLDRAPGGEWSSASRQRILAELPAFAGRRPWQSRVAVLCGIGAAGVTLRRWEFPEKTEDLGSVVRLRMEGEFPLTPDELAWGWVELGLAAGTRLVLVAAVKRSVVEEIHGLLTQAGFAPVVLLSALVRAEQARLSHPSGFAMLHLGDGDSEWLLIDARGPLRLRTVAWGESALRQAIESAPSMTAERVVQAMAGLVAGDARVEADPAVLTGVDEAARALQAVLPGAGRGVPLLLTGGLAAGPLFHRALAGRLGGAAACSVFKREVPGAVPVTLAALEACRREEPATQLRLEVPGREPEGPVAGIRGGSRKWMALAALLLFGWVGLPYAEAYLLRSRVASRVAEIKAHQEPLRLIDREADFLRHLKQNQTPHLECLLVVSRCAPNGAKIDSLSVNRKGEMSLRMTLRQPPEAIEFRNKLVESGFFGSLVVEDQSPSPDRQKLMVRISGQIVPLAARSGLSILSTNDVAGPTKGGAGAAGGPGAPQAGGPGPGSGPMPMPMPIPPPMPPR